MSDSVYLVAHCCRYWPIAGFIGMGKCGYCGEVPELVWDEDGVTAAFWSDEFAKKNGWGVT